jgi:hypothetical protein
MPRPSHTAHVSRQLQACHQYVILFCSSERQSSGSFDTGSLVFIQISSAGAVRLCSRWVDTADLVVTSGIVCSAKGGPLQGSVQSLALRSFSLLKPSGHFMHHVFHKKNSIFCHTVHFFVFCFKLHTNRHFSIYKTTSLIFVMATPLVFCEV